jgi:hypothetical protein
VDNYNANVAPTKLDSLSKFLGANDWVAGSAAPTVADFMLYEALDVIK